MFCPNCGTVTEAGQKYCRACGLNVGKVVGLISEQLPAGALERASPEEVSRLLRRKRGVERALVGLGVTGGSVFVLAIIYTLVFEIIIRQGHVLQGSVFLGFILAGVVALLLMFYRESVLNSLAARGALPEQQKTEVGAATAKLLPDARFDPIPSVTDRTTELLAAERGLDTKEV